MFLIQLQYLVEFLLPGFIDTSGQVAESPDKLHVFEMAVNDGEIKFKKNLLK